MVRAVLGDEDQVEPAVAVEVGGADMFAVMDGAAQRPSTPAQPALAVVQIEPVGAILDRQRGVEVAILVKVGPNTASSARNSGAAGICVAVASAKAGSVLLRRGGAGDQGGGGNNRRCAWIFLRFSIPAFAGAFLRGQRATDAVPRAGSSVWNGHLRP